LDPEQPSESEYQQVAKEFKEFDEQMRNPLVAGALLHKLSTERASSNLLLKQINEKLDRLMDLEARIASMEKKLEQKTAAPAKKEEALLPEVDEQILRFIQKKKAVCAAEVRQKFKYKGDNAACSRLNRLFDQGLLRKKQVGRKVFYVPTT